MSERMHLHIPPADAPARDAATPRPWVVTTSLDYWIEPLGAPNDGDFHGIAHCGDIHWPGFAEKQNEWGANARLICRAVNAHDALVAALRRLLFVNVDHDVTESDWDAALDAARAALALAEGDAS